MICKNPDQLPQNTIFYRVYIVGMTLVIYNYGNNHTAASLEHPFKYITDPSSMNEKVHRRYPGINGLSRGTDEQTIDMIAELKNLKISIQTTFYNIFFNSR